MSAVDEYVGAFPPRLPVAGILVSRTTYQETVECITAAAQQGASLLVAATSVHGLTLGATEDWFGDKLNGFDLLTPDGQPVRWALNLLHGASLSQRVYGPTLMRRVCQAAAEQGLGIYLYGSRPEVLKRLMPRLQALAPGLRILGYRSPPFRPLTAGEDADDVHDIVGSGARILFVGLGCPRQEAWAFDHRDRLDLPIVCVGAAFDFHAGALRQAPPWMQDRGLEWLFRLAMEPRRLWRRYAKYIPLFMLLVARQYMMERVLPSRRISLAAETSAIWSSEDT